MSPEPCFKVLIAAGKVHYTVYLCDNRDPINQGHVLFSFIHFELTTFSDGQLPKVSARPNFSTGMYESRVAVWAHD